MVAKPTKKSASPTKVTRIKAADTSKKAQSSRQKADADLASKLEKPSNQPSKAEVMEQKAIKKQSKRRNPLQALRDYFQGAWYELRQVRWPDRRSTWSMTGALLAFTAFFVAIILLLDTIFRSLFELILR